MRINIFWILVLLCQLTWAQTGSNLLRGNINLPNTSTSFLSQGTNYKPKNTVSAEKREIDASNAPKNHVYISLHPLDFTPSIQPMEVQITQRAKTFYPNVVAITKGSTVSFFNEDEHYHNIHSVSRKARFNIGRRPPGNVYKQKIKTLGVIRLGCDIHDEMAAVILSLDTPYFTRIKPDGSYQINALPDGRYEIRVFHPSFPRYSDEVQISGGEVIKNIDLQTP